MSANTGGLRRLSSVIVTLARWENEATEQLPAKPSATTTTDAFDRGACFYGLRVQMRKHVPPDRLINHAALAVN